MSCGRTVRPPRRATVSAMRRPATAVMLLTTTGIVVPRPSGVLRSTVEAGRHRRQARHHEHVAVGQVVRRAFVQQAHGYSRSTDGHDGPLKATGFRRPTVTTGAGYGCGPWRRPVVLVHGWGGSFATTWQDNGFTELLRDAGREVIGVDLLGHGDGAEAARPRGLRRSDDPSGRRAARRAGRCHRLLARGDHAARTWRCSSHERFNRLVLAGIGSIAVRHRRLAHASGSSPPWRAAATPTTTCRGCSCSTPTQTRQRPRSR